MNFLKCARYSLLLALVCLTMPALATPAIWTIDSGNTHIDILGSVHALQPGTQWLNNSLKNKISNADQIILELAPEQQKAELVAKLIVRYGTLAKSDALKNHLPANIYQALLHEADSLDVPESALARLKPWMAGLLYYSVRFKHLGYEPKNGVEAVITKLAADKRVPIRGLETAQAQVQLFDSMTATEQQDFVASTLLGRDQLNEELQQLSRSWSVGDLASLDEYLDDQFTAYPLLNEKLLLQRNRQWLPQIQALLTKPGKYLVVVGSAHLLGKDSLIDLLQKSGVDVVLNKK